WPDLSAGGITSMGLALELAAGELSQFPSDTKRLPPVLVLLTDGQPTDEYRRGLDALLATPWGKKSVRIAIAIGRDADLGVLEQFTGNKELVLEANNPQLLIKFIKWASTVVKTVSSPIADDASAISSVDINTIPELSGDDDDIW
ncbi:MAG: tellurium resistance protein, partial [Defluviitaleaceae bacterium]|nr:tellurium resistance protein [Defluviitaleaceae bacterium]